MAIRKPSTKRTSTADSSAPSTAPATPRRRTGAVRRVKTAAALQPAPAATSDADQTPAEEHIRVRAYYLHLERRDRPADPVADWLRAKQELSGGADTAHGSEA